MNYQLHLAEQRLVATTRVAASAISKILDEEPVHQSAINGYESHGNAYIAFLLVPGASNVLPKDALEAFDAAHCASTNTMQEAIEAALNYNGWEKRFKELEDEIGVDDLLDRDDPRLLESLKESYAFIDTYSGCHVFDLEEIERYL